MTTNSMTANPMATAKSADFRHAHAALLRAAEAARVTAKQCNTALIVQQNGRLVKLAVSA